MIELLRSRKWIILLVIILVLVVPYKNDNYDGEPCHTSRYAWANALLYQWHSFTYCNGSFHKGINTLPYDLVDPPPNDYFLRFTISFSYSDDNDKREPRYMFAVWDLNKLDAIEEGFASVIKWEW